MISRYGDFPASMLLLDKVIEGLSDSAAITKFLDTMDSPAMILAAQDENSAVRFLHINPSFTSLCGYELHEARGKTSGDVAG